MAQTPQAKIQEKDLTKGQLRKLTALRKSVGGKIADESFAKWLRTQQQPKSAPIDRNAEMLVQAVKVLRKAEKGFRVPRGGYLVTTGRGGVAVRPAKG